MGTTCKKSYDNNVTRSRSFLLFLGRTIYFCAVKTTQPRSQFEVPVKPPIPDFNIAYALECLLSRGFKVTDRVTSKFYSTLRSAFSTEGYKLGRRDRWLSSSQVCSQATQPLLLRLLIIINKSKIYLYARLLLMGFLW